jgi:hypothetical protein
MQAVVRGNNDMSFKMWSFCTGGMIQAILKSAYQASSAVFDLQQMAYGILHISSNLRGKPVGHTLGEGGQPKARWRVGSRTNKMDVFMYLYFF